MILDIQNTQIIIHDESGNLNSVIKSQLSFWDFKYDNFNKDYYNKLERQLFLKIINYLEKEGISIQYSYEAEKYSKDLEILTLNFQNLKNIVKEFKRGKYDKMHFFSFCDFVAANTSRALKSHQLKAAYHLYLLGNGANFSVPGSGKTSVVLTVYEKLRLEGKVNTLFVIGPSSCFGPWKNEFKETLGRRLHYVILSGGNKHSRKNHYYDIAENKAELYLTNFQSLLSDQEEANFFIQQKYNKVFLVIDEAHYIKQLQGNWAQSILKLAEISQYRCVLTGTPMPRGYSDIFNLFDFLWPNHSPITSNDKVKIKIDEERGNLQSAKKIMVENVGPLFYRVRKSELNLTPQNFLTPEMIQMNKFERKIYEAL